jgi:hypothetical protein
MKKIIIFTIFILAGCQSTSPLKSRHFLDGVTPKIGKYGYTEPSSAGYWDIHNTTYSRNENFGLLNLFWSNLGSNNRMMWLTTMPGGGKFCDLRDEYSGHAALKINGKWVKSDISCIQNGVLSFEPENMFTVKNLDISVAVVFDYSGDVASVYELDVLFDNAGAINAMKYVYDKSFEIDKSDKPLKN